MVEQAHPSESRRYDNEGLWLAATFAVVICLMAAGVWSSYWAEIRNDQYQLLHLGQCVCSGDTLYVDCWENKPPGMAWLNALALALGSGDPFVAWLLPGAVGVLCIAVMYLAVARALGFSVACLTALLGGLLFTSRIYDGASINPDFYSAVFELAAFSLWVLAFSSRGGSRRWCWGLLAGLAWAAAFTVKQTGIVGLAAVTAVSLVTILVARWRDRRWPVTCAWAWVGFALGIGGVAVALAREQALGPAVDATFRFNAELVDWDRVRGLVGGRSGLWGWIQPLALPLWLGLIGLAGLARIKNANHLTRYVGAAIVVWWIIQVALATLGPSRSPRYLQAAFPPMIWLGALGLFHVGVLLRRTANDTRLVPTVMLVTVVLLLGRPLLTQYASGMARSYLASQRDPTERRRLQTMGTRVRDLISADERMYVWNYDAGIYVHSARRCASAYTYPKSTEQMSAILSALRQGRTKLLLIPKGKPSHFDIWCDDACGRELGEILVHFDLKMTIGDYQAWVRR